MNYSTSNNTFRENRVADCGKVVASKGDHACLLVWTTEQDHFLQLKALVRDSRAGRVNSDGSVLLNAIFDGRHIWLRNANSELIHCQVAIPSQDERFTHDALHKLSLIMRLGPYIEDVFNEVLDEVTLGLCFEIHRSCKIGTFFLDEVDEESQKDYEIVQKEGLDVFGNPPQKKQMECVCPNCDRNLAASRFAPHLEKCLGMGRNSSRIASRRIANKVESDNEDDETTDLSYNPDRRNTKKKRDKLSNNSPRLKSKFSKNNRNGHNEVPSVSSSIDAGVIAYKGSNSYRLEMMTLEERKQLLMSTCGVISEHTKKMCTKSLRCPQHTDDQRRAVRKQLLSSESDTRTRFEGVPGDGDEIQVDIDSYEDGDGQALRDTLSRLQYDGPGSTNPSPADSTSTIHSNDGNSKKRKKSSKLTQRKKSKSKTPLHIQIPSQQGYELLD